MELREICELIVDCEHKTAPTQETGYPSIRTPNIGRGYLILDNANRVSEETYRLWTRRAIPKPGDLVMAREAPVGNVAIIPPGLNPCLGQRTLLIRCNKAKAEPSYVSYLLNGPQVQATIYGMTNGVTVPHLNMEDVRTLPIPEIPPLPTQRKIAAILSAYDDLIENNLRRIKILDEMAQNLYREWFVKFRFPGHQHARFSDSPLGRIPEGWEAVSLLSVTDVTYGFAFQSNQFNSDGNGMPVVRIRDVLAGTSDTFSSEKAGKKYLVENGDILVGMDGEFHMGFWVGGQAYLVQRVARFRSKGEIGRYHIFLALLEPIQHFNATITGTTVAHLGDKHIKTIAIKWPQEQLKNQFNSFLEPMLAQILNLRIKNIILRRTRDLLLPRLISGEVDVSALDIAIPEEASA
jgi:type I restriction enzyme S subunit